MAALLSDASLVVLLSEYETHPIAALEAAALGKPVLATDIAGMHELAEDGLAHVIPLDTPAGDLGRIVLEQLKQPYTPPSFHLPSWDDCADALLGIYTQHAESPRSR
jgi:glycosyltransferase involved in cell wall biosynthesis